MSHGGKRDGAGRPKGRKNVATEKQKKTIGELAKALAPGALQTLAAVMADEEATGTARVAAANSILDRAYGRPKQVADEGDDTEAPPMVFNINVSDPVGKVRVTKPE
ncbi:hypothetical protein VWZ82_12980 [Phaeobacter sp. JH20_41]|uniref:hypothetical protein n=1 Tax=Phaeobacter sp. JH20_41 TaxID=3112498 RepID=UPI003A8768EF